MFHRMIHDWFAMARPDYNDFIKAMFAGDVDAMNEYMNRVLCRHSVILIPETEHREQNRNGFIMDLC